MKKKLIFGSAMAAVAVVSIVSAVVLMPKTATSEIQPPYITDVNNRLDNHESRINDAENNISTLQETNGAPVTARTAPVTSGTTTTTTAAAAPAPTAQPATATPTPAPAVVIDWYQTVYQVNCPSYWNVHYSDGKTARLWAQPTSGEKHPDAYNPGTCVAQ